jgi:hypothetical protein
MASPAIRDLNARVTVRGCAPQLRFVKRDGKLILQQQWQVKTLENRVPISVTTEWRDIPVAEEH